MERAEAVKRKYIEVFGTEPEHMVVAPGRVNLIGEHTDYNDGFVLPAAIDYNIIIACGSTADESITVHSANFNRSTSFGFENIERDSTNSWCDYVKGVAWALLKDGIQLTGANMVIDGNVPQSSGLSSSAALEVATAFAFQVMNGFEMSGPAMALLCQAAENGFVGVKCGIMDQFISRLGVKDHALFIDCRSLEYEAVPVPMSGVKFVIVDTRRKRGLVDSEYNIRRENCEEAVAILKEHLPEISALRDVTVDDFERLSSDMPIVVRNRAEHVIKENDRVLQSVHALKTGDLRRFGDLMNESHDSLRDLYNVSCDEADLIVAIARTIPGVYGSRMTGAGFGGCTVSLIEDGAVESFIKTVSEAYEHETGIVPGVYVCTLREGAHELQM